MKIAARDLRPSDRIRGLGLTISTAEFADLGGNPAMLVTGHYASYDQPLALVIPADHQVRVVRPYQPGDRVIINATDVEVEVESVDPDNRVVQYLLDGMTGYAGFRDLRHSVGAVD